jgi:hypothetical protein
MAKTHILSKQGQSVQVVMHFPIPATMNAAGVLWRTALVNSGLGGTSVLAEGTGAGQITSAELLRVQSGELLEAQHTILLGSVTPGQSALDYLDAEWERVRQHRLAVLADELDYFGMIRQ